MSSFEIELPKYEIEEGVEVDLVVSGNRVEAVAGNRRGHPDTWTEGEGAYIERIKVFNARGCRLPGNIENGLVIDDRFLRAVEAAL